tara:strand:- start:4276 stop:5748 length:1473 start_codon:yes stop_codon:yes gene_type:complete
MSRDNWWVPGGLSQNLQFQACSGTRWRQIDSDIHQGHVQLNDIPDNTDMILLQAGGNNANFASVAYACIFTPQGWPNIGPEYPDPTGACYKEIEQAAKYIFGKNKDQLFQDARWIVNTVFAHPKVKNNPKFRLFIPGYFQFFYDKGGVGDWCDNASFALRMDSRPKLSLALRQRINELIKGLNAGIKAGVEGSWYPERAHFIDVDSGIQDGQFCQPGHSIYDQYFGDKVLLWNLSPEGVITANSGSGTTDGSDDVYEVRQPTEAEFMRWYETGRFTDDPREVYVNMSAAAGAAYQQSEQPATGGDPEQWLNIIGPFQNHFPGMMLRPFHPKEKGYSAMARQIMLDIHIAYDGPDPNAKPPGSDAKHTESIQLIFFKYGDYFAWIGYQGPQGIAVNPCGDTRFKVFANAVHELHHGKSVDDVPYPSKGHRWPLKLDGQTDCRYESEENGPGSLKCGNYMTVPLVADRQKDDKTVKCPNGGFEVHRAWSADF